MTTNYYDSQRERLGLGDLLSEERTVRVKFTSENGETNWLNITPGTCVTLLTDINRANKDGDQPQRSAGAGFTNEKAQQVGADIVEALGLKADPNYTGPGARWPTSLGSKTLIGLARMVRQILKDRGAV